MNKQTVLITGVGGGSIGEQVFKTLTMVKDTYKIIVTNSSSVALAVADTPYKEILPNASSDEYLAELTQAIENYKVDFLIPGSEPELLKISQNRQELLKKTTLLINSDNVISICLDKSKTFTELKNHNIRVPQTWTIDDLQNESVKEIEFPVIVKPAVGGSGSAGTFLAQDKDEMQFFVRYLIKYGYRVLIQEYIGRYDQEYTIGVLSSPEKEILGTVVLKRDILSGLSNKLKMKNKTSRKDLGEILAVSSGVSQGRIVDEPYIQEQTEYIAKMIGSEGPLNIQGRWDGKNFVPFEINPRFSGTTPMRAMAGFNEPKLLMDWHNGIRMEQRPDIQKTTFTRGLVEYKSDF